jgi:hypothetical protein
MPAGQTNVRPALKHGDRSVAAPFGSFDWISCAFAPLRAWPPELTQQYHLRVNVPLLAYLAPLFLLFEGWQLVIGERYLGVKQIARNGDPRELGPSEPVAAFWTLTIAAYFLWALAMLTTGFARAQILSMLVVTLIGYSLRRNSGLKYVLVVLTVESAIRIGMLVSLMGVVWRRL